MRLGHNIVLKSLQIHCHKTFQKSHTIVKIKQSNLWTAWNSPGNEAPWPFRSAQHRRGGQRGGPRPFSFWIAASARSTPAPPGSRTAARWPPRWGPSAVSCKHRKARWLSYGTPATGQVPYCDLHPLQQEVLIKKGHISNYFSSPNSKITLFEIQKLCIKMSSMSSTFKWGCEALRLTWVC